VFFSEESCKIVSESLSFCHREKQVRINAYVIMYNSIMAKKHLRDAGLVPAYRYHSPSVPQSAIRGFARRIAERFHPDKIMLFGSYAYGRPHEESDVDLLVIMPATDEIAQSIRITLALKRPFPVDVIVKTPKHVERGLREEDWFLREVMEKGKVLYEAPNRSLGAQGGRRYRRGKRSRRAKAAS
jgi:predicted nucleotidyltransferase